MTKYIGQFSIVASSIVLSEGSRIEEFSFIGYELPDRNDIPPAKIGKNCTIRSHSVIYQGNLIGHDFQTGHGVLIREFNTIGDHVSIGTHSVIEHHVIIGDNVRIHSNVFIPEFSVIESDAWIGPNVVFTNADYPANPQTKEKLKGPHILFRAKIGANATIMPGITVGKNALVGDGSVVTRDVPNGKVVAGNPVKIIGNISDIPDYNVDLGSVE